MYFNSTTNDLLPIIAYILFGIMIVSTIYLGILSFLIKTLNKDFTNRLYSKSLKKVKLAKKLTLSKKQRAYLTYFEAVNNIGLNKYEESRKKLDIIISKQNKELGLFWLCFTYIKENNIFEATNTFEIFKDLSSTKSFDLDLLNTMINNMSGSNEPYDLFRLEKMNNPLVIDYVTKK